MEWLAEQEKSDSTLEAVPARLSLAGNRGAGFDNRTHSGRGTEGSNLPSSSGESGANLAYGAHPIGPTRDRAP
jgi:hypothetical protein